MTDRILASGVVNNPHNGCSTGRMAAFALHLPGDELFELECVLFLEEEKGCKFRYEGDSVVINGHQVSEEFLHIGRLKIKIYKKIYGYGNWCWDAWEISTFDAARILNYLRRQQGWDINDAPEKICEKWEKHEFFSTGDITCQ